MNAHLPIQCIEENESENKRVPLTFSTIFGAYLLSLLNLSLFSLLYSCNVIFYNIIVIFGLFFFFLLIYIGRGYLENFKKFQILLDQVFPSKSNWYKSSISIYGHL